ncbi:putative mediator of RNA polymerase II transcription subunit 12 isoform X2 [Nematostella vectensis]|uniref:putative mediator of RNA polymerase II transcription subunit 12 isoform X2 n=1 Tax=Nematostella vectensis TaxID=45351 RepID=UPI0013904DDA|nr:putative mediator of RNA polymerase II transcription subunit 12 isoform X2 [Nematostella vectensis]
MEDGSGKCLLDVISDPTALNEFLRSNSQIVLDEKEDLSQENAKLSQPSTVGQGIFPPKIISSNSVVNSTLANQTTHSVADTRVSSSAAAVNPTVLLSTSRSTAAQDIAGLALGQAFQNGRAATSSQPVMQNAHIVRTMNTTVLSPVRTCNSQTRTGNTNTIHSSPKASVVSPSFQGKKPIPIQPKTPSIVQGSSSTMTGIPTNILKGLQVPNQVRVPQTMSTSSLVINGAESPVQQVNIRTQAPVNQQVLVTPPKRIAPKQQVMSPPTNSQGIGSTGNVIQMQPTRTIAQTMQVVSPGVQVCGAMQVPQVSSTLTQILPQQQLVNVVQQQRLSQPTVTATACQSNQHVQQIQQLVQQKFNNQQEQPSLQPQQKGFTPAQLQTALKQTKMLAQSTGQQPSLQVQQQILKQLLLLQQAQGQDNKPQSIVIQQQQQPVVVQQQQQQQPIVVPLQQLKQQPQQVVIQQQGVPQGQQQSNVIQRLQQQVNVSTQSVAGQMEIKFVTANQQQATAASNSNFGTQQVQLNSLAMGNIVSTSGHQVATQLISGQPIYGNTILTTSNQGTAVGQHQGSKQVYVSFSQSNSGQPIYIVSQPQIIVQQNNSNVKTVTSSVQQQTVADQQKQLQQILAQSRTSQSAAVVPNVQQRNQATLGQTASAINASPIVSQTPYIVQVSQAPQSSVAQPKLASTTLSSNVPVQQLTAQQIQQLQNSGGVQKVLIIKQPELLQKLGVQGLKPQQTIQITPQQLQVLQKLHSQQQTTTQKGSILTKPMAGTQPKLLTAQQLKQLQVLQQQQAASGNKSNQPLLLQQKQVMVQQLQRQLQTSKSTTKTQLPRILQTTGRQPVVISQAGKTLIKQEPRGVKRSHPDTPEPPKVVTRIKTALMQDQHSVLHPDFHTPFKSMADATSKLIHYHVYHEPDPTPKESAAV